MKNDKDLTTIQKTIEKLLEMLGASAGVNIEKTDDMLLVTLETEDSGMLIGYHGETLEALQLILSLVIAKELGEFMRISLEVGDYRKNRESWLRDMVSQTRQRAIEENKAIPVYNLKSWERREVHMLLAEDKDVISESEGQGRDRVLVIKPRGSDDTQEK